MTIYNEKIVDVSTGEEIIREYTKEEIAQVEASLIKAKALQEQEEIKLKVKSGLLERLGITEEEAKLLLG